LGVAEEEGGADDDEDEMRDCLVVFAAAEAVVEVDRCLEGNADDFEDDVAFLLDAANNLMLWY
jgi:hypothetical protein